MRRYLLVAFGVALTAAWACGIPAFGSTAGDGRLFYEMVVTNPGTRSQGWHGTLYGPDGKPVAAEPNALVDTGAGMFRYVACDVLWKPCGFIREGTQPVPATSAAALLDSEAWRFRLYVHAEGSRSEGWTGELFHGEVITMPTLDPVETPLGTFVWTGESGMPWGWSGWRPVAWQQPE